jgi:hypothetical protein
LISVFKSCSHLMSNFSAPLLVQGHTLTFYFKLLVEQKALCYIISVVDAGNKTCFFFMRKTISRWVLDQPVCYPKWIVDIEEKLGAVIALREHLN